MQAGHHVAVEWPERADLIGHDRAGRRAARLGNRGGDLAHPVVVTAVTTTGLPGSRVTASSSRVMIDGS